MDRKASTRQVGADPRPDLEIDLRVDVLGVGVSAIDMDAAISLISRWVENRTPQYVCVTGVHGVMESRRDPDLRRIHNESGLTTPDGMPMVWAGHLAGASWMRRVYGPDLMLAMATHAAQCQWSFYLYGGREGVADALARRLASEHPGLRIAGTCCPPFRPLSPDEDRAVVDAIDDADPDIVWIGLGTPKQERWMAEHVGRVRAPVLVGVGAAFDFLTGNVPQAPMWMQRSGLEWAFRAAQEPGRLGPRYLRNNPAFLSGMIRHWPRLVARGSR